MMRAFFSKLYGRLALVPMRLRNRRQSTARVFTDIYRKNAWGGEAGEFFSGTGSRGKYAEIYCTKIREFLDANAPGPVTLVDLGCGDFAIGRSLVDGKTTYIGVDIVAPLVERNIAEFAKPGISFRCLDLVADELPAGDVCLVRTVLQHLSNDEIRAILPKLITYRFCLITEHYPSGDDCVPNRDKPHGADIRLSDNSAVYLDKPPFSVRHQQLLFSIPHEMGGELRTFLVRP